MMMMMMVMVVIMMMMMGTDSIISSWVDIHLVKQNRMLNHTKFTDQQKSQTLH